MPSVLKDQALDINESNPNIPSLTPSASEALNFILDRPQNTWLKEIHLQSVQPPKYQWSYLRHNGKIVFACCSAGAIAVTFYLAGEKDNAMEAVGSVFVNGVQAFYFSFLTADFFLTLKKDRLFGAAMSGVLGTMATVTSSIGAYFQSKASDIKWFVDNAWVTALLNAGGNFSQNMVGTFGNFNKIYKYWNSNPEANLFLLNQMRDSFRENQFLSLAIRPERSLVNTRLANTLAVATGVALAFNQTGYVCASERFFADLINEMVGIILAITDNTPLLAMTGGISGPALATIVVNKLFDLANRGANYLADKPNSKLSAREIRYEIVNAVLVALSGFMGSYSGAASAYLYESQCPDAIKNPFLAADTNQGAQLFNSVNCALGLNLGLIWQKTAYVKEGTEEHAKYLIQTMVETIEGLNKVEAEARAEALGWEKAQPSENRSCLSRLFSKSNPAPENYQALADENAEHKRSWCSIM